MTGVQTCALPIFHADLQSKGVRCWFAPHKIKAGEKIHDQIDEAIRLHDKLLLILSEHSMASEWVKEEIARARKREAQEKRQMLFPVALVKYDPVIREWECFDADRGKGFGAGDTGVLHSGLQRVGAGPRGVSAGV